MYIIYKNSKREMRSKNRFLLKKGVLMYSVNPDYKHEQVKKYIGQQLWESEILKKKKAGLELDYDEWFHLNENELLIQFAETGADREMCFDSEREFEKRYELYLKDLKKIQIEHILFLLSDIFENVENRKKFTEHEISDIFRKARMLTKYSSENNTHKAQLLLELQTYLEDEIWMKVYKQKYSYYKNQNC